VSTAKPNYKLKKLEQEYNPKKPRFHIKNLSNVKRINFVILKTFHAHVRVVLAGPLFKSSSCKWDNIYDFELFLCTKLYLQIYAAALRFDSRTHWPPKKLMCVVNTAGMFAINLEATLAMIKKRVYVFCCLNRNSLYQTFHHILAQGRQS
jgi:hypothetical protein